MGFSNGVILITYPDSLGKNLRELAGIMEKYFSKAITGLHILPFYPSSGDRGFAPITYKDVEPAFGSWEDIAYLAEKYDLTADLMVNHISRRSHQFLDYVKYGDESPYADMFIRFSRFWKKGGPDKGDIEKIYKRKPKEPSLEIRFGHGGSEKVWSTFDAEQIDLNISSSLVMDFLHDSLVSLAGRGASVIRLDAFGYAVKKEGTDCFFVEPEIWDVLSSLKATAEEQGAVLLPEIHENYTYQLKLAEKGYWVYDFALPMLVLHALFSGTNKKLLNWLRICPRKQFTTLDTHDGIGIVDAADLLDSEEIEKTKACLFEKGANVKPVYSTSEYNNLDVYQINCTYYSALGHDDSAYLLARAIQYFSPGIPHIYYTGLLAGENDTALMEKTKFGRDINRHSYSPEEVESAVLRPVVKALIRLTMFRSRYPAFQGDIDIGSRGDSDLELTWQYGDFRACLTADLKKTSFSVVYTEMGKDQTLMIV